MHLGSLQLLRDPFCTYGRTLAGSRLFVRSFTYKSILKTQI